jgi:hypothetical protein
MMAARFWARVPHGCSLACGCANSVCTHPTRLSTGSAGVSRLGNSTPQTVKVAVCAWGLRSYVYCHIKLSPSPTPSQQQKHPFSDHFGILPPFRDKFCPHRLVQSYNVPRPRSGPRGRAQVTHKTSAGGPECCLFVLFSMLCNRQVAGGIRSMPKLRKRLFDVTILYCHALSDLNTLYA